MLTDREGIFFYFENLAFANIFFSYGINFPNFGAFFLFEKFSIGNQYNFPASFPRLARLTSKLEQKKD